MFEVEFRCRFNTAGEAYHAIPFLRSCLGREVPWKSTLYGLKLFQSGKLLRVGEADEGGKTHYYIAWKGPDTGKFCNIRQEVEDDITSGVANSSVLSLLGGKPNIQNKDEAIQELERLGYHAFMSWSGNDIYGFSKPHNVKLKLMYGTILKWPVIVEMEKMAATEEEAVKCEKELYKLSRENRLQEYIFKEEPPQLLYEKVFGGGVKAD